ncbi:glycosyltransferase family 4 protein [Ascidiimonas aurantiaca]|uniref:glycosyltransferase n=1 Tax=Ascidiimonas aurantiaca TaxID=1685432 RepID=UPI0030EE7867
MPKLLIVGYVWPEPSSSAAGRRMMELIDFFLSRQYSVVFTCVSVENTHAKRLRKKGVTVERIVLNSPQFDDFIESLQPELVLFDRFMMEEQFGWRVAAVCPEALRILDTEDLHFLRKARETALKKNKDFLELALQSDLAKREVASIYRCDLTLMISDMEIELLTKYFQVPEQLLHLVPFMGTIPDEEKKKQNSVFENRKNFIAIGNFRHTPNTDALHYLKTDIWPLIRKELPDAEVHIYGAYMSKKNKVLEAIEDGFYVSGWVANAAEVMAVGRVCLAPLRFGAGLKGKLLEAMENGTPSVTTSIGAEGMHGMLPWNGIIANTPQAFASAAITLYQDPEKWQESVANGYTLLENRYHKKQILTALSNKIKDVFTNKETYRNANFTGAMLMHHRMQSTKYLSKYITLKNTGK